MPVCRMGYVDICRPMLQIYLASRFKLRTMYHATVNNSKNWDIEPGKHPFEGKIGGEDFLLDVIEENGRYHVIHENKSYNVEVLEVKHDEKIVVLKINNLTQTVQLKDRFDDLLKSLGMEGAAKAKLKDVKAPMPGMVLNILVEVGQEVQKDEALLILEAMKMENVIKSPAEGKVKAVRVNQGVAVEKNTVLIEFE